MEQGQVAGQLPARWGNQGRQPFQPVALGFAAVKARWVGAQDAGNEKMAKISLAIRDGAMASEAYFAMEEIPDPAERTKLRAALREYCRRDTLGLVRLLEKMQAMQA